jgi:subtilase family serine protease
MTILNKLVSQKMNNSENLATYGTQDEEKQSKNTTQYVLDTTIRKQTQITYTIHERSYKQLEVKINRTSFLCGNSNGHHNPEPRTYLHT